MFEFTKMTDDVAMREDSKNVVGPLAVVQKYRNDSERTSLFCEVR